MSSLVRTAVRVTVVAWIAAGCSFLPGRSPSEIDRIIEATDWTLREDVRIELKDSGFAPRELKLVAGRPYRLTIVNLGVNAHYFNAPEFFASIAARKVEVPRYAEVKAAQFSKFELFPAGGLLELWFVPLEKGRFRAHCHLGDHAEMGVEGHLIVQ